MKWANVLRWGQEAQGLVEPSSAADILRDLRARQGRTLHEVPHLVALPRIKDDTDD